MEILIVDGGSTDETQTIVRSWSERSPQIRLLHNKDKFTPFALNLGIEQALGKYVLIASAHSSFSSGYLEGLLSAIKSTAADAVGGIMQTRPRQPSNKSEAFAYCLSHKFGVGNSTFRTGTDRATEVDTVPFGLYLKETLVKIGSYNTQLIRNQDIEMSKRLIASGGRILLIPSVTCTYYSRESWRAFVKNAFENGKWNILTVKITKKWSSLSLRHFIPLFFLLSLLLPLGLAFVNGNLAFLILLPLAPYLGLLVHFSRSSKASAFAWRMIGFFSLHLAYGAGSFVALLTPRKS